MRTFTKNGGTKLVSGDNAEFAKIIIADGWVETIEEVATKKREAKNATDSTDSN